MAKYPIRSLTFKEGWTEKTCLKKSCGKTFWVIPSKADTLVYCSDECRCPGVMERLMAKIKKTPDGHWLWTGASVGQGYGKIKDDDGKQWRTHRLAYTLFIGPIPEGLDVLHKRECVGHPNCCAPDHLYVGTVQDNTDDRMAMGRQHDRQGERCPTHILIEQQVIEIRALRWTAKAEGVAATYGIKKNTVWGIWLMKTWKHLQPCPPKPLDGQRPQA